MAGIAGSAKSIFCLHYAYHGPHLFDQPSIYITLEESSESLRETLRSFGMPPESYEAAGGLNLVDMGELRKLNEGEEFADFDAIASVVDNLVGSTNAVRFVLDSLAVLGLHLDDPVKFRRDLFRFGRYLRERGVTSLLVTESIEGSGLTRFNVEQFIADAFIHLGLVEVKGELQRTILVRKMRFTHHDAALHPFLITENGLKVSSDVKITGGA